MPSETQKLGRKGESQARRYLIDKGWRPKDQNWHCRYGELDLIMWDGDELVFVEVKYRKNHDYGRPEEMVSFGKMKRMIKSAERYLFQKRLSHCFWRFDIVAVSLERGEYLISHFSDAIRES